MTKLCINCKHSVPSSWNPENVNYLSCDKTAEVNPVTGEKSYIYCQVERREFWKCKPEGKLYEPKKSLDNTGESVDNTTLFSKIVKFFKRS